MPVFEHAEFGEEQPNKLSIPIMVDRYIEDDQGIDYIQGRRLDSAHRGETVAITLSRKHDKPHRLTIPQLRDGYEAANGHKRLEPGGIISFRDCWPLADGVYAAKWPNVVAYSRQGIEGSVIHARHCVLRVGENRQHKPWGEALILQADDIVDVGTIEELMQASGQLVKQGQQDGHDVKLYLRALNHAGNVITGVEMLMKGQKQVGDGEEVYALPVPEEVARRSGEVARALAELSDGMADEDPDRRIAGWSLIPMVRIAVSSRTLSRGEAAKNFTSNAKAFKRPTGDGDVTLVAKEAFLKVGGNAGLFVNGIYPVDPYGNGLNPDLLGGLSYIENPIMDPRGALRALRDQHRSDGAPTTRRTARPAQPVAREAAAPRTQPPPAQPVERPRDILPGFKESTPAVGAASPARPTAPVTQERDMFPEQAHQREVEPGQRESVQPAQPSRAQSKQAPKDPGDVFNIPSLARDRPNRPR